MARIRMSTLSASISICTSATVRANEPLVIFSQLDMIRTTTMKTREDICVLQIQGTLRVPMNSELRDTVAALLHRSQRRLLLDLARLTAIDAAGVGELIHAFTLTNTAGGVLQVARARWHVRHLLDISGVLDKLSYEPAPEFERATWHESNSHC
jgi:anti-anti-sigma factor